MDSKAGIRAAMLARRDGLAPERRIEMSLAMAEAGESIAFDPGTVIAGYLPIRSEPDLRPLMARLGARGARLCLPVVLDRQTIVFRDFVRGAELVNTGFGTSGPGPDAEVLDPQILLMPLSAFDAAGNRLGYGAGHYDRAIAQLHGKGLRPRLIGTAFSVQEAHSLPHEAHDVALEMILTERGLRSFSQPL
ncbi:MAG: 5-formyltetrahydrofolate cyclo-ligase [Hoeflea sp.]|uniref:5-formyltetrahydrofolate cyclo-ligase n=1 Tax=Hoeflea sp. TaxID=1940281 RepID=UPI002730F25F|nr:5-formyltetrahydrofolate cyclo-ligase [Hoeflea sp.]MDP2122277.1 5-formyltetrahydrofolate cyclo-ligase [Hoeflea sp.]MDP3526775.1 5-formyltetrahydrofolate cyclo-ligase [Hoeflea sp.]